MLKRVVAVHDISCVGKCSLTVALPVISAAGIECSVLPTAILSTHTGGFEGFTFHDLTDEIRPIYTHWKTLNLNIDCIYTGYLGSARQIQLVEELAETFSDKSPFLMVDPAMADNGKLYSGFTADFVSQMAGLCSRADVIVPNITEAAFMLGIDYKDGNYDKNYIESILYGLRDLGAKNIILSGVSFDDEQLGAAVLAENSETPAYVFAKKIPGYYHGTGDLFASVALCGILTGHSLEFSAKLACDYTAESIQRTYKIGTEPRFGVDFESGLSSFAERLK